MHPDNAEAVDDLVERLRSYADNPAIHSGMVPLHPSTVREAANAIEQKDKLIAELRGALAERQAAIDELVTLKNLKDIYEAYNPQLHWTDEQIDTHVMMRGAYDLRKPLAWQRARALASPATKGETT